MSENLPELLATFGPFLLFVFAAGGAFGLPVPATLTLIAAGALSTAGGMSYASLCIAAWLGTVCGDHAAYWLGRKAGGALAKTRIGSSLGVAEKFLARWGVFGVFFSRWILQSALVPAVNYLSGINRYALIRFTPAVMLGQGVYVLLYSSLGRAFSGQVKLVYSAATTASLLVLALVVGLSCLGYLIYRLTRIGK